eukprot:gb/GECG01001224.1/.p1 GENE.gb/GECG01001224.1/~~gb/GECG01001224.1/.p1  ORF type:complete len:255 (+),score=16.81 gb/GECG01001224.1/:1-765(+)
MFLTFRGCLISTALCHLQFWVGSCLEAAELERDGNVIRLDEVCVQNSLTPLVLCSWICVGLWMTVSGHILSSPVHSNILSWASEGSTDDETHPAKQRDSGYIKTGRRLSNMLVQSLVLPPHATIFDGEAEDLVDANQSDTSTSHPPSDHYSPSARRLTGGSRGRYSSALTPPPTTGIFRSEPRKRNSLASYLTGMYSSGYLSVPEEIDQEEQNYRERQSTAIMTQPRTVSQSIAGLNRVHNTGRQGKRSTSTLR